MWDVGIGRLRHTEEHQAFCGQQRWRYLRWSVGGRLYIAADR